ncbi:MAG: VCBS repeat-containing protein, partial [Ginsengibacter sp.]
DFTTYANEYKMFGTSEEKEKMLKKKIKEMGEVKKSNFIFKNNTDLTFSNQATDWGLADKSFSNGAAYVDFDNDGDLDIVMNNLNDKAFVYRNNIIEEKNKNNLAVPHFLKIKLKGAQGNLEGIGAKITIWNNAKKQYAEQALQRGYLSSVDENIFFGLGNASIIDSLFIQWPSGKTGRKYVLKADQLIVLKENEATKKNQIQPSPEAPLLQSVASEFQLNYKQEENEYLDFLYQFTLPHRYSIQGPSLAVGDINGDGIEDVYAGGSSRHSGFIFLQTAKGFQQKQFAADASKKLQEETGTLLFDADNDGDNDLYCVAGGNEFGDSAAYQDLLYLNDGKGNFSDGSVALPNTTASGSCVIACDFDHDGDLDLFIGGRNKPHQYPLTSRSYLLRNDVDPKNKQVHFTDVTNEYCKELAAPGMVTSALWTDYDNDGFADLMIVGEFMPIELFKNIKGKSFTKVTINGFAKTQGWYNSLAAGDFDNDGDIDYVAGNLGLNSKYKASVEEPVIVRYNDFNKDKALDAFLFAYNNKVEYFTQPKNVITDQIASLKNKIYYYYQYGKIGYKDIFSAEERKDAKELQAFQMSSVYIENKGSNNFVVKALPMMAQVAPMNGILSSDVDNDGNLDIVSVGNFYGPEALTGRYDASVGWVLKGNGKGDFQFINPQQSGFYVGGDARAIVRINKNNKTSLLMASGNSGLLEVFNTPGVSKCIPVSSKDVYLVYHFKNGHHRKEELYFGSSYLSQSGRFITVSDAVKSVTIYSSGGKNRFWVNN